MDDAELEALLAEAEALEVREAAPAASLAERKKQFDAALGGRVEEKPRVSADLMQRMAEIEVPFDVVAGEVCPKCNHLGLWRRRYDHPYEKCFVCDGKKVFSERDEMIDRARKKAGLVRNRIPTID